MRKLITTKNAIILIIVLLCFFMVLLIRQLLIQYSSNNDNSIIWFALAFTLVILIRKHFVTRKRKTSIITSRIFEPNHLFDIKDRLPKLSDFPEGTEFIIKEFNVPLVNIPGKGWFNWWGATPSKYDVTMLKPGNNWEADSFEHWLKIVEESI
jgi:hypothetical protein